MPITFSPVVAVQARHFPGFTALAYIDLDRLGVAASPVAVLDDFRVTGLPFAPHPHAGFAAVTYVFEDSPGDLRSRTSSGVDLVVRPGGIVWTHAGHGLVHEEIPAVAGNELHGLQLFVNLSAANKSTPPQVLHLQPAEVPQWHGAAGDRVRVVVGSFAGVSSPLVPTEPFTLLDVRLRYELPVDLPDAHNAVVYVLDGSVTAHANGRTVTVDSGHALALRDGGGHATLASDRPAHALFLSGAAIGEPVVVDGPFIMNEPAQIEDAVLRYRAGTMGRLAPLP